MDIKLTFIMLLISIFTLPIAYASELMLRSKDFNSKGVMPVLYTCDGKGVNPNLFWDNPPEKTRSFVLMMTEKDSHPTNYLWVLYNIPKSINHLTENSAIPNQIAVSQSYTPPCPPTGEMAYYNFTLYALSSSLNLKNASSVEDVIAAMETLILDKAEISIPYPRWVYHSDMEY